MLNKTIDIKLTILILVISVFAFTHDSKSQKICPHIIISEGALILDTSASVADFVGGMIGTFDQAPDGNVNGGLDWMYNLERGVFERGIETSSIGAQLISWWTRRNGRNTVLQVTNQDKGLSADVHVQIFDKNCREIRDFCDVYTQLDTHFYDFSNLVTNSGQLISSSNLANKEGIVIITPVDVCNPVPPAAEFSAMAFSRWQGDVTIQDVTNQFDYHAKVWARGLDTLSDCEGLIKI